MFQSVQWVHQLLVVQSGSQTVSHPPRGDFHVSSRSDGFVQGGVHGALPVNGQEAYRLLLIFQSCARRHQEGRWVPAEVGGNIKKWVSSKIITVFINEISNCEICVCAVGAGHSQERYRAHRHGGHLCVWCCSGWCYRGPLAACGWRGGGQSATFCELHIRSGATSACKIIRLGTFTAVLINNSTFIYFFHRIYPQLPPKGLMCTHETHLQTLLTLNYISHIKLYLLKRYEVRIHAPQIYMHE